MSTAPHLDAERADPPRLCLCGCGKPPVGKNGLWATPGCANRRRPSAAPLAERDEVPELVPTGEVRLPKNGEWHQRPGTTGFPARATMDWTIPGREREILRPVDAAEPAAGAEEPDLPRYALRAMADHMLAPPVSAAGPVAEAPAADEKGVGAGAEVVAPSGGGALLAPGAADPDPLEGADLGRGGDPTLPAAHADRPADVIDLMVRLRGSLAAPAPRPAPTPPADYPAPGTVPAVGIYRGVPAEVYHSWRAASNSILGIIKERSPAHAYRAMTEPRPRTPALIRGDALHTAVLEPKLFEGRYALAGLCVEPMKSGDRKGQECGSPGKFLVRGRWYCGKHADETEETRTLISAADYADCRGMAAAVRRHPRVADLLDATDDRELSIVFDWPGTRVRCKARVDIPAFEAGVIGDVKTTLDASTRAFQRSVATYGYHRQAPFYQTACFSHGYVIGDSLLIAVEPDDPYPVNAFRLTDGACEQGRQEIGRLLTVWQRCVDTNEWPGYGTEIVDISLPDWAWTGEGY